MKPRRGSGRRRGYAWIGEEIAHAKAANPTTLLTSPTQEELRRGPGAGGGAEMFDFVC